MKKAQLVTVFGFLVLGAASAGCGGKDLAATVTPDESGAVESPANNDAGETSTPSDENPDIAGGPMPGGGGMGESATVYPNEDAPGFGGGIKGGRGIPNPIIMDTPFPPSPQEPAGAISWDHANDLASFPLPSPSAPPPAPSGPGGLDHSLSENQDALAGDVGETRECFIQVPGHEGIRTPC